MKNKILLIFLFIAGAISNMFANPGDTITLDLSKTLIPDHFEFPAGGGAFTNTDDADDYFMFEAEHFSFSYFDAYEFTVSNRGDNTDHGSLNVGGGSTGWLGNNMWGTMAGGGIKTDANGNVLKDPVSGKVQVQNGIPFVGAYYSSWMGAMPLQVTITDAGVPYKAVGMYVNNNPWAYYGNIYGDGFARILDQDGDFFQVTIHGLDENYNDNGTSVVYTLAKYENGTLTQNTDWEWVDLSSLGEVYGFSFTVEGSDASPYGLNTAAYFNLDKLQVRKKFPPTPSGLQAVPSETNIVLTWTDSENTDGVSIAGYNIYVDGVLKGTATGKNHAVTGLTAVTQYTVEVEAFDAAGTKSGKATITVSTTDETAPTVPTDLTAAPSETEIALSWTASTDNVGVAGYNVYMNGLLEATTTETAYTITGLTIVTEYTIEVEAFDAAGNKSGKAAITVSTIDETAPTAPTDLSATSYEMEIAILWTASTDNIGVAGYNIYANGQLYSVTNETSFMLYRLNPGTEYTIEVEAFDAAGNKSAKATITASTLTGLPSVNGNRFAVYPNPFAGYIVIEATTKGNATICDLSGKPVLTVNLKTGSNRLVTSSLPKGIYVLNFDGNTMKIVK